MNRQDHTVFIKLFVTVMVASFIGTFAAKVLLDSLTPEPVTINVIVQDPEKTVEEIIPENVTPTVIHQTIDEDFDILQPCGYSVEQLTSVISDDSRKALVPYVDTFLEAEETYGINAFYLICKFGLESGWGQYESGENNIGGWTNADGTYKDFDSVEDCIMYISESLSTSYKNTVGTRLEDVCERYCPNEDYLETLLGIMEDRQNQMKST